MGPFRAVGRSYLNMLNFTGRARRAEFWWFAFFQFLVIFGGTFAFGFWLQSNPRLAYQLQNAGKGYFDVPADMWTTLGWVFAGYIVLLWLPMTASIIRRLHDSNRSGAWYFIQFVPFIGGIWMFILLLLPGTHGNNDYGPDSVPNRKRKPPAHPAFAQALEGPEREAMERQRKVEIKDYYKKNVLPGIQQADA